MDSNADAQSWEIAMAPGLDVIEAMAIKAYAELPDEFRALSGEIRFHVADFPDDDVIREMELQSPF
ncbi:MAG TPA: Zn-dependent protease, partial [Aurantimonas sp.]